jgi:DNA-binding SARP family transcriptional activator
MLAVARQQRADGRVAEALATYERVELTSLSAAPAQIARRERLLLAAFADRSSWPTLAWVAALRDAVHGDHTTAAALSPVTANDLLAIGLSRLLAGDARGATESLRAARTRADASPTTAVAADVALLVAGYLGGWAGPADVAGVEHAMIDVPFLSRLARAAVALVTGSPTGLDQVGAECEAAGDHVGTAVVDVLTALHEAWHGGPPAPAAVRMRVASSPVRPLASWLDALAALGSPTTTTMAVPAGASPARRRTPRPLQDLAALGALTRNAGPDRRATGAAALERLRRDHGIVVPVGTVAAADERASRFAIRCFGRFSVELDGEAVGLGGLRPRAREVLRLLAVNLGRGVHRDVIVEMLWPGDDEVSGGKKLHVAVSAIRGALDAEAADPVVVRDGDAYLLSTERVTSDVLELSTAVAAGRAALAAGDRQAAQASFARAVALHDDVLLPEDGAADWVVPRRDQVRDELMYAAEHLTGLLLADDRPGEAVSVCRHALRFDGYCDPVWRGLLEALRAAGDHAGHAVAAQDYERVLEELGVARTG